jgi:DNA mismatch repair protein MutS
VHVAQLAGLPRPVVERARELLAQLEAGSSDFAPPQVKRKRENPGQLAMFDEAPNPALQLIQSMKVDELSPIEALTKLYELKRLAGEG